MRKILTNPETNFEGAYRPADDLRNFGWKADADGKLQRMTTDPKPNTRDVPEE